VYFCDFFWPLRFDVRKRCDDLLVRQDTIVNGHTDFIVIVNHCFKTIFGKAEEHFIRVMPVAPPWARARVAGTVIKRRLKRVADFFIFDGQSLPRRFRFPVYDYIRCKSECENCNSRLGETMDLVTVAKFLFTASVIVFSSCLSQKRPDLAGFIIALPLASLLALALAHLQHGDAEKSIALIS
jgi:hypothetical protein